MTPSPWHAGHAPLEFALNIAGCTLFAVAKDFRMASAIPEYVARLLRREPGVISWSTTTASGYLGTKQPWIKELLPLPATPVTAVSTPFGILAVTLRRLFRLAFWTTRWPLGSRYSVLSAARCDRCWPVLVPDFCSAANVPWKTTVPPPLPAPGPMSTM